MLAFHVPTFLRPRRSFHRLRSFHLSPAERLAQVQQATAQAHLGGTKSHSFSRPAVSHSLKKSIRLLPRNDVVPLRGSTLITLAIIASLVFIFTISIAFVGANVDELYFTKMLDGIARTTPGVVLIGENVDVDVDEPSITIRWSILACGEDFLLPGSAGAHGSDLCGLPATPLYIFVDNDQEATATYDPSQIPFNTHTGHRRSIQNLVQFDSDHVLDVHQARLYPFDTYLLSSTIRAVSFTNETIPIRKLSTIDMTSSFLIDTADMESYSSSASGAREPSRDLDMRVRRPGDARAFALLLFALSWVLTHVTIGHVILARRLTGIRSNLKHVISAGAILVTIPQLRDSMPDAPGLDGALIDSIGFFPQMVISGLAVISLLLILAVREFDIIGHQHGSTSQIFSSPTVPRPRPPRSPTMLSSSTEVAEYDLHRLLKHLKGQYVFPPVQAQHIIRPSSHLLPAHRRCQTMSKVMEAGEVKSRWSDSD